MTIFKDISDLGNTLIKLITTGIIGQLLAMALVSSFAAGGTAWAVLKVVEFKHADVTEKITSNTDQVESNTAQLKNFSDSQAKLASSLKVLSNTLQALNGTIRDVKDDARITKDRMWRFMEDKSKGD